MREFITVFGKIGCAARRLIIWGKHYRSQTRLRKNHKSRTTTHRVEQTTREKAEEFVEMKRKIQRTATHKFLNIQVLHSFR